MTAHRAPTQALPDPAEAVSPLAVLGLREWFLGGVRAAIGSSGFAVADVAPSTSRLLHVTAHRKPRLAVAALDVLGVEPAQTIRRMLAHSPGTAIVVLSPLDILPAWLLDAGADAVVPEAEIGELKRVLRDLHHR